MAIEKKCFQRLSEEGYELTYNNDANLARKLPASLFTLWLSMIESLLLRRQKLHSIFAAFHQSNISVPISH